MSKLNLLSTDSLPVIRRKYVSKAKRNFIQTISSVQYQNNETFSSEIRGFNTEASNIIEMPCFEMGLEAKKNFPVLKDSQDYNQLAKENTQDSINISSSSIEEIEDKFDKKFEKKDEVAGFQDNCHRKEYFRNSRLSVQTKFSKNKEDEQDFCESNESTPHLYVEYTERLKNILLEYFDE